MDELAKQIIKDLKLWAPLNRLLIGYAIQAGEKTDFFEYEKDPIGETRKLISATKEVFLLRIEEDLKYLDSLERGAKTMSESVFKNYRFQNLNGTMVIPETEEQFSTLMRTANIIRNEITENAQWLRFAESAMFDIWRGAETVTEGVEMACDFADAMLEEAKKRGRV